MNIKFDAEKQEENLDDIEHSRSVIFADNFPLRQFPT